MRTLRDTGKPAMMLGLLALVSLIGLTGCNTSTTGSAQDQENLKKAYSKKGFDLNEVPPQERERVRGLMQANGAKPPSAPGNNSPAPAGTGR